MDEKTAKSVNERKRRGRELRERIHRITNELQDSIKHLPDALLRVPAKGWSGLV